MVRFGSLWALALCCMAIVAGSPASAQLANADVYIFTSGNDPLGISTNLMEMFRARGAQPKLLVTGAPIPTAQVEASPQSAGPVSGSAFFISEDGYALTNDHVVRGRSQVQINHGGRLYEAKVVRSSAELDVAVLKIADPVSVPYFDFAKSAPITLGSPLFAIGFPLPDMLGSNVRITQGIVSAASGIGDEPTKFQITAAIQPGNSGGPIITPDGHIIGVAVEKLDDLTALERSGSIPQSVNFGIKASFIAPLLEGIAITPTVEHPPVADLTAAIAATAQVLASNGDAKPEKPQPERRRRIAVTFRYQSSWDVFVYQLTRFEAQIVDADTGEVIKLINRGGDYPRGKATVLKQIQADIATID